MAQEPVLLVYDKQCPVCDFYCQRVRLRDEAGELRIVDARAPSAIMEEITSAGLDIDQGMVVKHGGVLYYGSDAIHRLALLSERSGWFNRLSGSVLRSRTRAHALYPVLRFFRNLLLKLLGRTKVNNLRLEDNGRF